MAEKRQKKQAAQAFEKETFSKDKEVTGATHTENRQDNTFSAENQYSANEKPVSNLPRDANHGSCTGTVTSGHNVQKLGGVIWGQNIEKKVRKNITTRNNRTLLVTASRSQKSKRKRHS